MDDSPLSCFQVGGPRLGPARLAVEYRVKTPIRRGRLAWIGWQCRRIARWWTTTAEPWLQAHWT